MRIFNFTPSQVDILTKTLEEMTGLKIEMAGGKQESGVRTIYFRALTSTGILVDNFTVTFS